MHNHAVSKWSEELLATPGEPRWFLFSPASTATDMKPYFSQAFPSKPSLDKQSLWTVAHGIHTEGLIAHEGFDGHRLVLRYVTVQVADPQVPTPFKIHTIVFVPTA